MTSRVALITGGNRGIGASLSEELAKSNCMVWLGSRNVEAGEATAQKLRQQKLNVQCIQLDLNDCASIAAAADRVSRESHHLDILVNNAAIGDGAKDGPDGPPSKVSIETLQKTMQTNFVSTVAVTQAFLPLVQKSSAGRIVNVSSELGSLTYQSDPNYKLAWAKYLGYSASKAALNMMTVQLAYELRDTPIKVNSVNPGFVVNKGGPLSMAEAVLEPVRLALLPNDGPTGKHWEAPGKELPW